MTNPAGAFAEPQYLLRRMIALSPTFQAARGVSTWSEAMEFVLLKDADPELSLPVATVFTENLNWRLIAGGTQNVLRPSGTLFLYLAQAVDQADYDDQNEAATKFGNFLQVIDDVADLAGADQTDDATYPDSHLPIKSIDLIATAESPRDLWSSCGRFYWAAFAVQWGDEQ